MNWRGSGWQMRAGQACWRKNKEKCEGHGGISPYTAAMEACVKRRWRRGWRRLRAATCAAMRTVRELVAYYLKWAACSAPSISFSS